MAWHPATIARVLTPLAVLSFGACGGGKKTPAKPKPTVDTAKQTPPPETEEDREKKRHEKIVAIIPENSTCLPTSLKEEGAPRLDLAAIGKDAVVCAIDEDRSRLLGSVGCWKIDLGTGSLTYQMVMSLPGRDLPVKLEDRCARGYCLPKDAKLPADNVAHMAWNLDSSKVAVLAGDDVHIYDASSRAHESSFSIRGDKGVAGEPIALYWNGEGIFVEAGEKTASNVWLFKPDGTAVGVLDAIGGKTPTPLSTYQGSFSLLDEGRVAVAEQGFSTVTTYETATGKRTKLVRKIPAGPCKKDELDAYWKDASASLSPKCKDFVSKNFAHLIGAEAVAGSKNLLVLLRGPRLGELAVIDSKTLAEKKAIKMPWCEGGGAATGGTADAEKAAPEEKSAKKAMKAAPKASKAAKGGGGGDDDPDAGGQ